MTKGVLERELAEELTDHLGYEVGDPAGQGSGNSRNGYSPKTLLTEAGAIELDVPRDRNGTHQPRIVRKGQRRMDGIDKIVIGLYAHGMTVRDIQDHLAEIYDIEVSPDLISKITDAVIDEVREWQARPLEPIWPVIFLDAIICKVRDAGDHHPPPAEPRWPPSSQRRPLPGRDRAPGSSRGCSRFPRARARASGCRWRAGGARPWGQPGPRHATPSPCHRR